MSTKRSSLRLGGLKNEIFKEIEANSDHFSKHSLTQSNLSSFFLSFLITISWCNSACAQTSVDFGSLCHKTKQIQ